MAKELRSLIQNLNRLLKSDKVLRSALVTVLADHKERIFTNGEDVNGSKIGRYSKDPVYVSNKKSARRFTGKGRFFPSGYDQYKEVIGKNPGFVNLENTGTMMKGYSLIALSDGFGFGFSNSETANLSYNNEHHFNKKIFDLSKEEEDKLVDLIEKQIDE